MRLSASLIFHNEDTGAAAVSVHTDKTFYKVAIMSPSEVYVVGPGVEELFEDLETKAPFARDAEGLKARAILAVLLFENQE